MRKVVYGMAIASLGLAVVLTLPHAGWSHPSFQHFPYVGDGVPACAVCHSSVNESYQPELLTEESKALVPTITKHYKAIEEPDNRYRTMEPDQRKQLLEQTKKIDQNSSVKLEASAATVAPGGTITVTVTTKGGIGPVVGIMLVDEPLRYQARPVQSTGWSH